MAMNARHVEEARACALGGAPSGGVGDAAVIFAQTSSTSESLEPPRTNAEFSLTGIPLNTPNNNYVPHSEVGNDAEDFVMVPPEAASESPHPHVSLAAGPGTDAFQLPALLGINEVSSRLTESASSFARRLTNLVDESVIRDMRQTIIEPITGALPRTPVMEQEINFHPTFQPSSNGSISEPPDGNNGAGLLCNLSVERATSLLQSTSAAMMGMGQHFLSAPPAVWNGFDLAPDLNPQQCTLCHSDMSSFPPVFNCPLYDRMFPQVINCPKFLVHCPSTKSDAFQKLVTRVQTTLRGSADDIGWLVNTPGAYPRAEDGTEEFLKALEQIGRGVHTLPNTLTYLLVPGLFSNHGPLYFYDTKKHFTKLGLPCHIAKIHSESAVEKNAKVIKEHIEELYASTGKKVVLLGHSKGGVDASAACSMYWPQLRDKVVGCILVQSPYAGTPIASDILREGQIAEFETRRIMEILICKIIKGDLQSLEDLTYERRRAFLARNPLPADVPVISFHTEANRAAWAVSIMSHVAHAQLPWLPGSGRTPQPVAEDNHDCDAEGKRLHVAVPLAAAMAMCALHLELRYGEKSDGLVCRKDAEVPGSVVVKPEKKLDHAWMVYAPSRREPNEPDAAQMCEALIAVLLSHPRWRRPSMESNSTPTAQSGEAYTNAERSELNAPETNPSRSASSCPESSRNNQEPKASSSTGPSDSSSQNNGTSDPDDFLTTDAARSFLRDKDTGYGDQDGASNSTCAVGHDNNREACDEQNLALEQQIANIVVLETIAQALNGIGEPTNHMGVLRDQTWTENFTDDIHG